MKPGEFSCIFPKANIIALLLVLAVLSLLKAQNPEWKVYNTSNSGLANSYVFETAFEPHGVVWIGTNDGLSKFNGFEWTTYRMNNSGLPANIVTSLMVESPGRIWIGTDGAFTSGGGGVAILDGQSWTTYTPSNSSIPDKWVTAIEKDANGNVWVGTDNGLVKFEGSSMTILPYGWQTYYESVSSLAIKDGTVIMIGTGWGVSAYDNGNFTLYRVGNSGMPADNVWAVEVDSSGTMWVGTNTGGLARFDGTDWTVYNTSNSGIPVNDVTSIAFDLDRSIWIGTWNGGLAHLRDNSWTIFNTGNSQIPSDIIYSVNVDELGNKWIGTTAGLAEYRSGGILGTEDMRSHDPASLGPISPNPLHNKGRITLHIHEPCGASLSVYNSQGMKMKALLDEYLVPGNYDIPLEVSPLLNGLYFCVLEVNGMSKARPFIKSR